MLKIYVDSGSSIKKDEALEYGIKIIPLKLLLGNKEYLDNGEDLSMEEFYHHLVDLNEFPKTSLPNLYEYEEEITKETEEGNDVIIITISSHISGTYNAFRMLFEDNKKVLVIDSKMAVGGLRFIVELILKNKDKSLAEINDLVNELIPRIQTVAIPETLNYLFKGGRLSKAELIVGSILQIKPILGFKEGKIKVHGKSLGLKKGMKFILDDIEKNGFDPEYGIIASYTHIKNNVDELISKAPEDVKAAVKVYDDLDPAIASHWGPGAFGFIYVKK
ncbi:MAG: DegV family protein [Acholeplasmatales bacterium]|nr:DegV family protein [Acholeplasmatales bacterium]